MGKQKPCNWCGHTRSQHEPHKYGRRELERAPRDYPCTITSCWCSSYEPGEEPCNADAQADAANDAASTATKNAGTPSTSPS